MSFWTFDSNANHDIALFDESKRPITYSELNSLVEEAKRVLLQRGSRLLCFLFCSNDLASLVAYLACLRAKHVPLLLPAKMKPSLSEGLANQYKPSYILGSPNTNQILDGSGIPIEYSIPAQPNDQMVNLHPDLALLLSTSGTTGSPKLVRLSYQAIQSNAESIKAYLDILPIDRALMTLPFNYSYGLSVINSHLLAKGSLVLGEVSVVTRAFEETLNQLGVTSFSGVPSTFQMLSRTGFSKLKLPQLRTITQAGGKLDDRLTREFLDLSLERGWRFFVMYGQTEATARISFVPPSMLARKIGSIGIPIPNGKLSLDSETSEIIYSGPNVMMGYASTSDELALPDQMHQTLRTGDLGRVDQDGYFFVTGRIKRFIKLSGNRINLDEVEHFLQSSLNCPVAVGGRDERMIVWIESNNQQHVLECKQLIQSSYSTHHTLFRIKNVGNLPLLSSGKKDYAALEEDV